MTVERANRTVSVRTWRSGGSGRDGRWPLIERAYRSGAELPGKLAGRVEGGRLVRLLGFGALLPEAAARSWEAAGPAAGPPARFVVVAIEPGLVVVPAPRSGHRARWFARNMAARRDLGSRALHGSGAALRGDANSRDGPDAAAGCLAAFAADDPSAAGIGAEREAIDALGRWLRDLRIGRMSLKSAAAAAGTTAATLSLVERGLTERGPTAGLIGRILFALDRRLAFLVPPGETRILVTAQEAGAAPVGLPSAGALDALLAEGEGGRRAAAERAAIDAVGTMLRTQRGRDRSLAGVARAAGTTAATLSLVQRALTERGPTIGLVARIAAALGRPLAFDGR